MCLLVQVETMAGIDALDDILAVDGVDGVFIGPSDLAADMGYLGKKADGPVQEVIQAALGKIAASDKAAGCLAVDDDTARTYAEWGAQFLAVGDRRIDAGADRARHNGALERWLSSGLSWTLAAQILALGWPGLDGIHTNSLSSFRNSAFEDPIQLVQAYLAKAHTVEIGAICAGVAGPVRGGTAELTNHTWHIDSAALQAATGAAQSYLLNDLQAQGYALDDLEPSQIVPLFPGKPTAANAARLVMGLGTGSNVAVVHKTPTGLFVPPAESGHASLPYAPGRLSELIAHIGSLHAHRPMEAALSGPGLSNIYEWCAGQHMTPEDIISAHQNGDAKATEAVEFFCQLLGQVAGDLALAHLPMGGVYFIGGMARAVAPLLEVFSFRECFTAKGPYTSIMESIPVSLITDDHAALRGCVCYLRQTILR